MAGALQPRRFGVWPLTTSFDLPPARRDNRGEEKVPMTAAEGRPHVRGDDGDEAGAGVTAGAKRREPRRGWRARAATRPPKEHPGDFDRRTVRPAWVGLVQGGGTAAWRFDVRSRRGDPRLNLRSREGHPRSDDDARCGRGGRPPQGAARRVGAGAETTTVRLRALTERSLGVLLEPANVLPSGRAGGVHRSLGAPRRDSAHSPNERRDCSRRKAFKRRWKGPR
jgi:hypothetical protein